VGAFLFVGEDVVGGFGFFEFGFGFFAVVRVAVRVVFHRQFAERFFDVVLAGGFGNAEDVVEVFFCHFLWGCMEKGGLLMPPCQVVSATRPGDGVGLFWDGFVASRKFLLP